MTNKHIMNVDTGIINFHNLTGVISKVNGPQFNRRLITYRSMKHFDQQEFTRDLGNIPFHICEIFDDIDDNLWAQQHLMLCFPTGITRPMLERRTTLGHLRSIKPNMINLFANQSQTWELLKNIFFNIENKKEKWCNLRLN